MNNTFEPQMSEFGMRTLHRDLAIKLAEGLKGIPEWRYTGKVIISDAVAEKIKHMSPKEMAMWWGDENELTPKNQILVILQEIYKVTKNGPASYSARDRMAHMKMDFNNYLKLFRIGGNPLFVIKGNNKATKYKWISENVPIFSDAEDLYMAYKRFKAYRLNPKQRMDLERNQDKPIEEILQIFNIIDPKELECARLKIKEFKQRAKYKEKSDSKTLPKPENIITSHETRTIMYQNNDEKEVTQEDVQDKNSTPPPNGHRIEMPGILHTNGEGELFILHHRVKLQKSLIKNLESDNKRYRKLNKTLNAKVLELSNLLEFSNNKAK